MRTAERSANPSAADSGAIADALACSEAIFVSGAWDPRLAGGFAGQRGADNCADAHPAPKLEPGCRTIRGLRRARARRQYRGTGGKHAR